MISKEELQRIAAKKGKLDMVEKDYALTWALEAIYSNAKLAKYLVFKGGTCLSKVYADAYRISEDLDFSAYNEGELTREELEKELRSAFESANKRGAPNLQLKEDETHENAGLITFKVRYAGPLGQPGKIKIELSKNEYVKYASVELPLKERAYLDIRPFKIHCYHFFELFVEKLRAIMQRGKSRDYYDVWQMLKRTELRKQLPFEKFSWHELLYSKCFNNRISYEPEKMFGKKRLEQSKAYWQQGLDYLVRELPPFEEVIEDLRGECEEEFELAVFSESLDASHFRSIARNNDARFLCLRGITILAERLDSKNVREVEKALDAAEEIFANTAFGGEMRTQLLGRVERLTSDNDKKIRNKALILYEKLRKS